MGANNSTGRCGVFRGTHVGANNSTSTYHDLDKATGWAGVSIDDYPVLTVTREHVAPPKDAAQGSSGEVVVSGKLKECPA